ncbi:hypothetical protein OG323_17075 [Streptomyces cyaneofuscatus]|nr:hypothetical protein OG323_17075 [Streptomyces cyaneofuscatus]
MRDRYLHRHADLVLPVYARAPGRCLRTVREGGQAGINRLKRNRRVAVTAGGVGLACPAGRDTTRNEHEATTSTSINDIARGLTIWMAIRGISARQA